MRGAPFLVLAGSLLSLAGTRAAEAPVFDVYRRLRTLAITEEMEFGEVPPPVAADLTRLKHLLRDLVVRVVTAPDAKDQAPAALRARIVDALRKQGVPVGGEATGGEGFGTILAIDVEQPSENPDWLVAVTQVSIPCGSDSSLMLFERGERWRHALTYEAGEYPRISEAKESLDYRVSPRKAGESPYLIVADTNAWCTSYWRDLRYRVLRPAKDPDRPDVLTRGAAHVNFNSDDVYDFAVRAGDFDLVYRGAASGDDRAGMLSLFFVTCRTAQARMSCSQPAELDAPLWMQSWLGKPWDEARKDTVPADEETLRSWHERLHSAGAGCWNDEERIQPAQGARGAEIRFVVRCKELPAPLPSELAFAFVPSAAGFHLAASAPPGSGPPPERGKQVFFGSREGIIDPIVIPESKVAPQLTADARAARIHKSVRLAVVVESDGSVGAVSLVNAEDLDHGVGVAVIEAVEKWRFEPGTAGGIPVAVSIELDVEVGP